jgi:hypothetical protein
MRDPMQMTSIKVKKVSEHPDSHVYQCFPKKKNHPTKDLHFYLHVQCTLDLSYEFQWLEEVKLIANDDDNAYVT